MIEPYPKFYSVISMSIFQNRYLLIGKRELPPRNCHPMVSAFIGVGRCSLDHCIAAICLRQMVWLTMSDTRRHRLYRLVEVVSRQSPQSHPELLPPQNAELSFWINAYNLLTIWAVLSGRHLYLCPRQLFLVGFESMLNKISLSEIVSRLVAFG